MAGRRKWLQVHLSTAVVLMIAAGGLVWANVMPVRSQFLLISSDHLGQTSDNFNGSTEFDGTKALTLTYYGRPKQIVMIAQNATVVNNQWVGDGNADYCHPTDSDSNYSRMGLAVDIAVALTILFAVWFVCEWWIRRRAARKQGGGS